MNIENMGGRDQSQMKNKSLKSSKKSKSVPKDVPKSHNDDSYVLLGGNIFDRKTIVFLDLVADPVVLYVHIP